MGRRRSGLLFWILAFALLSGMSHASVPTCEEAAARTEKALGLPAGLLRSIGQVESGGSPYTVDSDGAGSHFASAEEAASFVRTGAGRYVDVGCFQVDLAFHPTAFRSLDEAFNPLVNAEAAGRLLLSLRESSASWSEAVARYHSADPALGGPYAARVYASLGGGVSPPSFAHGPLEKAVLLCGMYVITPGQNTGSGRVRHFAGLPTVQTP